MAKKRPKRQPSRVSVDVLETRAIVLVDEYGSERVSLCCSGGDGGKGGSTVIHINDDRGRPRLTLQVDSLGNPSICLFTPENAPGISLAVNHDHGNGIGITDVQGTSQIVMGIPGPKSNDPRGCQPDITVIDARGGRVWSVFQGTCTTPDKKRAST